MQKRFLLNSKSVGRIRRNIKMLTCSCNSILDIFNLSRTCKNFEQRHLFGDYATSDFEQLTKAKI